ncbi:GAF domain-containing protein [Paenibacillus kandeliae]|uniref:GAF domain-containing protein n=1 Tax=Paenibacillus kandeliae TaxID=3231269 RepID=UPI00345A6E72
MENYSFFTDELEAADHVIEVLSNVLTVNTVFIASNDGKTNRILRVFNREEVLVNEGLELPLQDTYCGLISGKAAYVAHTSEHPSTCMMPVTETMGDHSFIGFPVNLRNGEIVGTICAMHSPGYIFSKAEVQSMYSMAILMSHVTELQHQMDSPLVR